MRGVNATLHKLRRGEQKVVRLQRRLWLAQLLFWPTTVVAAVGVAAVAWKAWQRRAQPNQTGRVGASTAVEPTPGTSGAAVAEGKAP